MERDNAERESREKETKILNQTRELDELRDRVEEVERLRTTQARELDDLMSSKDDAGKSVSLSDRPLQNRCPFVITLSDKNCVYLKNCILF